jgi:S1-C subfamily serine protease
MAVAATPEQPNRAGILIIAVPRDSVARMSGIIVGDILYEFDGHPIRQLTELQAAVAACAPNSAVPVKLYRGTDPIALTARF